MFSCCYLGEKTDPHLAPTSLQAGVESEKAESNRSSVSTSKILAQICLNWSCLKPRIPLPLFEFQEHFCQAAPSRHHRDIDGSQETEVHFNEVLKPSNSQYFKHIQTRARGQTEPKERHIHSFVRQGFSLFLVFLKNIILKKDGMQP